MCLHISITLQLWNTKFLENRDRRELKSVGWKRNLGHSEKPKLTSSRAQTKKIWTWLAWNMWSWLSLGPRGPPGGQSYKHWSYLSSRQPPPPPSSPPPPDDDGRAHLHQRPGARRRAVLHGVRRQRRVPAVRLSSALPPPLLFIPHLLFISANPPLLLLSSLTFATSFVLPPTFKCFFSSSLSDSVFLSHILLSSDQLL